MTCHCGRGDNPDTCCLPFISGDRTAASPEQLMRSRYTAFCLENADYLHQTWLPEHQHSHSIESILNSFDGTHWCRLDVVSSHHDGDKGFVEFIATYVSNGAAYTLHEASQFTSRDNKWYYDTGEIMPDSGKMKLGRNDPCPCLSGKKFKRCCATKA